MAVRQGRYKYRDRKPIVYATDPVFIPIWGLMGLGCLTCRRADEAYDVSALRPDVASRLKNILIRTTEMDVNRAAEKPITKMGLGLIVQHAQHQQLAASLMLRLCAGGAVAICRKMPPHARLRAGHPAEFAVQAFNFPDACAIGVEAPSCFCNALDCHIWNCVLSIGRFKRSRRSTMRRYNPTSVPQYHHRAWAKQMT